MRNEPSFAIFRQAFSLRIKVADAIQGALTHSSEKIDLLREACTDLEDTIFELDKGDIEDQYRAYHAAASIFLNLAEWKHAIRNAELDSRRFLNSAKLKSTEVEKSLSFSAEERLNTFLQLVDSIENVDDLVAVQEHLNRWDLPLLLFSNLRNRYYKGLRLPVPNGSSEKEEKLETTVAFLKFDIDGEPAKQWNYLKPGTSYDLTIEVRVSNWPTGAKVLVLTPVTIDAREREWLPRFTFDEPEGEGPFIFTATGRAVLEVAHSFGSRPYEFLYAAEFDDNSNCHDVAIIGHRRLLLEGSDVASNPLSGFSNVDRHLINIRDQLRSFPGLPSTDIANTMTILGGLGNIAAQALKGGLFKTGTSEKEFQEKVSAMLRNRSDIGENLQGHPEAAGGITDLTLWDIPIELKVEKGKVLFPKDFKKFFDQTAAYAIGLGKRIGVLSVLETSPKSSPVGVVEDDIDVFVHQAGKSSIMIVVVVVRGGFPKPSSYSR
jgi:hypothetical protein